MCDEDVVNVGWCDHVTEWVVMQYIWHEVGHATCGATHIHHLCDVLCEYVRVQLRLVSCSPGRELG